MRYSKYLIIITNFLLSTMLNAIGLFFYLIPATFYENESIIHNTQKKNIGKICNLINARQLEKEAKIKPRW